jgi:membrane protein required for colicin V production
LIAAGAAAAGTTTNWLDAIIIGILAFSTFIGVRRGLLRSVAAIVGLVLAALFAGKLAALIDPTLAQAHIKHPPINGATTFVIAFVAIVVAVEYVAGILVWVQRLMFLGWVDRLGGAVFGLIRGVLLSMILLAGFAQFGSTDFNNTIRQATVAVWLWNNLPSVTNVLPPGMQQSTLRLIHDQAPFLGQHFPGLPSTP